MLLRPFIMSLCVLASACGEVSTSHCIPSTPAFYCAEHGPGHVQSDAARDCEDASGTLADGPCSTEREVGRCTQEVMGGDGPYLYAEVYYSGFAGLEYTDPSELDDLRVACVSLRGGEFETP